MNIVEKIQRFHIMWQTGYLGEKVESMCVNFLGYGVMQSLYLLVDWDDDIELNKLAPYPSLVSAIFSMFYFMFWIFLFEI